MDRLGQFIGLFKFRDNPRSSSPERVRLPQKATIGRRSAWRLAVKAARAAPATSWNINDRSLRAGRRVHRQLETVGVRRVPCSAPM